MLGPGAGQGAGAKQVARPQVAAVGRVVRHQLGHGPVGIPVVGLGDSVTGVACSLHLRGLEPHLQFNIDSALRRVFGRVQVIQRGRVTCGPGEGFAERGQCVQRHDPGGQRAGEVLRQKRPQGLVFPALHVAGAPVVEQGHTKHMVFGLCHPDRLAQRV